MQMGYKYPPKPVVADHHTISVINLNNHITLNHMKGFWVILALSSDITDFFA